MQDEPRKPGADAPEEPTNRAPAGDNTLDCLNLTSVVHQSAVMIISKRMKRAQSEPEKSNVARWLHEARGAWDRVEEWLSSVPLSTDRLIADSTDRLITFRDPCLNIHLSRNRALERKSK